MNSVAARLGFSDDEIAAARADGAIGSEDDAQAAAVIELVPAGRSYPELDDLRSEAVVLCIEELRSVLTLADNEICGRFGMATFVPDSESGATARAMKVMGLSVVPAFSGLNPGTPNPGPAPGS